MHLRQSFLFSYDYKAANRGGYGDSGKLALPKEASEVTGEFVLRPARYIFDDHRYSLLFIALGNGFRFTFQYGLDYWPGFIYIFFRSYKKNTRW